MQRKHHRCSFFNLHIELVDNFIRRFRIGNARFITRAESLTARFYQFAKFADHKAFEQPAQQGAIPGIKFALGENVKQSNWGDRNTTRYPQTRMGVESLLRDRFAAATVYAREHASYRALTPQQRAALEARDHSVSLAAGAGCQPAYISHVLSGQAELTPEHAEGLARFWDLSLHEGEYFLELVAHKRAGTPGLRARLERRLAEIQAAWEKQSTTFAAEPTQDRARVCYRSWKHSAVHLLLTVPGIGSDAAALNSPACSAARWPHASGACAPENR